MEQNCSEFVLNCWFWVVDSEQFVLNWQTIPHLSLLHPPRDRTAPNRLSGIRHENQRFSD